MIKLPRSVRSNFGQISEIMVDSPYERDIYFMVLNEAVEDIPLLLAQMEQRGLRSLLDEHEVLHGN